MGVEMGHNVPFKGEEVYDSTIEFAGEKVVRLFGFEISRFGASELSTSVESSDGHESLNSSQNNTSSCKRLKLMRSGVSSKFVCQSCFKVFPSSHALGGHQNAHKKEKMKNKKRLAERPQIRAQHGSTSNQQSSWCFDRSLYSQISFSSSLEVDDDHDGLPNGPMIHNWHMLHAQSQARQDSSSVFTLTTTGNDKLVAVKSVAVVGSNRNF